MRWFALLSLPLLLFGTAALVYALWGWVGTGAAFAMPIAGSGVVLLSGQLTWDHTFLRRALEADSTLAVILSMIPVFTPLLMMLRIAVKMPPVWQILLAYALTALFNLFMVWAAARIYRIGILMYGKKPTVQEILRWVKVA